MNDENRQAADAREPREPREPRPVIERLGLAAIALVLAILFGGVAVASWVGALTLIRG